MNFSRLVFCLSCTSHRFFEHLLLRDWAAVLSIRLFVSRLVVGDFLYTASGVVGSSTILILDFGAFFDGGSGEDAEAWLA